ncbi:MAG: FtsX-like permease family protein [Planctomycetota bacterium]
MGLALTIARRSLLGRPGRTFFAVLGVAVGIATVVAVFTVDHVSVRSRTRWLDPGSGADFEVRPRTSLADPAAALRDLEGVAGVAAFFENDVGFRPLAPRAGDDRAAAVQLTAIEVGPGRALGNWQVERGADLRPGHPDELLVGRALAQRFGLEPGDRVLLAPSPRAARTRCVEGELRAESAAGAPPPEEVFLVRGVLAPRDLGRKGQGDCVILDYDAGRRLFRDVHVEPQYWIDRAEDVDLEVLEARLGRSFTVERDEAAVTGQRADERAFRNGVRVAGLFALLLGLFVIFHTLSMSLLERVREVGSLHALGTTRGQIARVFFVEAFVIAVLAGGLGFALGILLASAMLRAGITTLGVAEHAVGPLEVPWRVAIALTLLGVSVALAGAVYPLRRVRGANLAAALREDEPGEGPLASRGFQLFALLVLVAVVPAAFFVVAPIVGARDARLVGTVLGGLGVLALLIGIPLLLPGTVARATAALVRSLARRAPLAAHLAARSLAAGSTRSGASVAAIALVTTAFVALRGMTASLEAEIDGWAAEAVDHKVWVEDLPDVELAALAAELHARPEVLGVEQADVRAYVGFLLIGVRPAELARFGPALADPRLLERMEREQGIVVSRRLARQRGLGVGDTVLVNTSGHGVQEFRIAAISDAYGYCIHPDERAYAVAADRWLHRYFCLDVDTVSAAAVRLVGGADPLAVEAILRARHADAPRLRVTPGVEVRRLHVEDIGRDFVVFDIILLLTAVLAGLGVLNGLLLAALERRKEFGVLRALGMTDAQLAGAVLLESAALGLAGGAAGLAVGAALTPLLVSSLRVLSGLDIPLRLAGADTATGFLVGALLLALAAGLYPLWRLRRMDAVAAVRTG